VDAHAFAAMRELVGDELACRVIEHWAGDHYRAIYRLVLDHEMAIAELIGASGLRCP
jgi:hypothetical protein